MLISFKERDVVDRLDVWFIRGKARLEK